MMDGKVFGIGLARTGTTSLNQALNILGYRSIHFPYPWSDLSGYDAATDTSCTLHYKDLARRNPEARFVLTVRDIDSWTRSMEWLFATRTKPGCVRPAEEQAKINGLIARIHRELHGTARFEPEVLAKAYRRHEDEVTKHFSAEAGRLLRMNIAGGEGWEKLCPFLGKEIPAVPFPHLNLKTKVV